MTKDNISIEDALKRLRELGIDVGEWKNTEPDEDVEIKTLPTLERQAEALKGIGKIMEKQIEKDQDQIADLDMKLKRLMHGGGR